MNDKSYFNWSATSDSAIAQTIGKYIKHERTEQNRTQSELAKDAGISRSTLSLLERGEPVMLFTLLQVLRILDCLHVLDAFNVQPKISPMLVAEAQQKYNRLRVRKKKSNTPPKNDSSW